MTFLVLVGPDGDNGYRTEVVGPFGSDGDVDEFIHRAGYDPLGLASLFGGYAVWVVVNEESAQTPADFLQRYDEDED